MLTARGIKVAGTAVDGLEAVAKARRLRPDVILMDITMPRCDGFEATRRIKAEFPEVKVVMVTASFQDEDLFEAIKCGASGYLLKSVYGDEFCAQLEELATGEAPLARGLSARVLEEFGRLGRAGEAASRQAPDPWARLTARQKGILDLVARGLTYKEVAAKLHLGERTVKYHMRSILEQLHLETRAEAIAYAVREGLTPEEKALSGPRPVARGPR